MTEKKPAEPYSYSTGSEPIAACGAMRPFGARILARAILDTDYQAEGKKRAAAAARAAGDEARAQAIEATILSLVHFNAIDAAAFEIVAVGKGCAVWCEKNGEDLPTKGQHCDVRSVASDRVYAKDVTGRFWLVPMEDVGAVWDPCTEETPGLVDAVKALIERKQSAVVPSSPSSGHGEANLSPQA